MKRKETVTIFVCDNPECQSEFVSRRDSELPTGYHIKNAYIVHGGGASGANDVYACSEDCVVPAIDGACDR